MLKARNLFLVLCLVVSCFSVIAREQTTNFKYKKYEKFDFEEMRFDGSKGSPGDLSIVPRFKRKFKNKLPYRKNFNQEIRKAVERIR